MDINRDLSAPVPTTYHLSVQIIGSIRIQRGNTMVHPHELGGPKPRKILEILLLRLGTPVSKDRLIEMIWEGHPPAAALATLESYVSVLRRRLQPGLGKYGPLQTTPGGYLMDRSMVDLDVTRFNNLIAIAEQATLADSYPLLCQALEMAVAPLLGDELLPGWAEEERGFHTGRVTGARIRAAEAALKLGKFNEAVVWSRRAVIEDPLNESAWTLLITGLEEAGHYAECLRAYEQWRQALNRELGCEPGPALRAAHARLLQATAANSNELSDVLSALLMLNDRLSAGSSGSLGPITTTSASQIRASLEEAGKVVDSFLRRALAAC
ncbi:BTAD domain-containing putative transcriptional regulator [Arthrobacter sp. 260]|uniref:AfsR/SARP family transcriptional regulator n=1 Tax=Arthrobacter sp. 260 TaxID=2735314 RepID=UPI001491D081|nr:BTAD domain-containing putative transcriptional regulator [Arthrobacter sp. 260]NOJ60609.1 response regulator receiver protein [Arthrobacter sp. 260]